jgi:phosphosulfolactate synthase
VQQIRAELEAGAWKVVTEGRESGTVGLYRQSGEIRTGLIEEMEVQIDTSRLIFEAPQKAQQVWLVKHFGCNVNLGNIAPQEVISLETIRQGLRADTMGGNGPH